ncbi:MAG TPA: hypothetical protein VHO06_01985 [Polyangia bacterium]|nr:hypothetical protein [Polyangia bacterium]
MRVALRVIGAAAGCCFSFGALWPMMTKKSFRRDAGVIAPGGGGVAKVLEVDRHLLGSLADETVELMNWFVCRTIDTVRRILPKPIAG